MKPRSCHYGQKPAATTAFVGQHLRVQVRSGSYAHRSVTGVLACVLGRGFGPGTRIVAPHLRAVAAWSAGEGGGSARLGSVRSDAQLSNGRGSGTDAPQAPAAASRDRRV